MGKAMKVTENNLPQRLVVYDGSCKFCITIVKIVKFLDFFKSLKYANFRDSYFARYHKELLERLESEFLLISPGNKMHWGFFAARKIMAKLPLLWILVPFAYLPFAGTLGTKAYAFVSKRRLYFSRFLRCESCET